jgi:cytidyltransferase-like protein
MKQHRVMVDMSATIIHHGHIRLLKKAAELGHVVVGLTADDQIITQKGYQPEIDFEHRKEILEAIKYVDEVVEVPWLLDDSILDLHEISLLVHGDDNSNVINKDRLKVFPRTKGISSSEIRQNTLRSITQINNQKLMLTPGPAVVLHENIQSLMPIFGRGDEEYKKIEDKVLTWVRDLSGQDQVISAQGSATFALELAAHSFVHGKVLLISTGYYSDRLEKLLPQGCELSICDYEHLGSISGNFDWVMCAYTETSIAFKVDLCEIRSLADKSGAKLYVDATGSIGLEDNHELADIMAFSSCKGLFGLTGACFIAHKDHLKLNYINSFYSNINTHKEKMVTGAYHSIASLYSVIERHEIFKQRVINSKQTVMDVWSDFVRKNNQPLLCTYLEGEIKKQDNNIILYTPRSNLTGSVLCHFGEIHTDDVKINHRITVNLC